MWSGFDVLMRQGLQFAVTIILARILTPNDFGVIALLGLFIGIASVFIDGGFSSALIQRQNVTHKDESTVFFFNLAMAGVTALLLSASAIWLADFFKQPILQFLTYAMAFNLLINAFGAIHATLLTKELNFKVLAKVGVISSSVSGIAAVYLAMQGFGVWSLVWQGWIASFLMVSLLWVWHPWRPSWTFSFDSLKSLFGFGGYEMAATLTDVFSTNFNLLMIGKLFSAKEVGLYDRAQKTQLLPTMVMMRIIDRVAFSAFSVASADKEKLVRGLRRAQSTSMFINVPAMIGLMLLAQHIMEVLFGEQWVSSAPILQVLAIAGILWPLHVLNLSVLKAQGRADLFFWISLLKKVIAIALTIVASFYGVMAIAWAQVATSIFAYFVNAYYSKVFLDYGAIRQLRDIAINFIAVIPMAVVVHLIIEEVNFSAFLELALATTAGGLVYLATTKLIYPAVLDEFLVVLKLKSEQA